MRRVLTSVAVLLLATLVSSTGDAAKPLTPKAQLEKEATAIIVGKVRSIASAIASSKQYKETFYVAAIPVDRVEKGAGLNAGDIVYVHYWSREWIGTGRPPPDDGGHWPAPKSNDVVRVYLTGKNREGGYNVYFKNGFEILPPGHQPPTAAVR